MADNGLPARLDPRRPFDHGTWVPLSLMYPQADIPVLQVSLPSQRGPAFQTHIGRALAGLREEGILLIGSGSITHNLRELDWHAGPERIEPWAKAFRDWMIEKLEADDEVALHDYRRAAPMPRVTTPVMSTCCPCFSPAGPAGHFTWRTRAGRWVRWAWIFIDLDEGRLST